MNLVASLANLGWLATGIPAWRQFRRGLLNPEEAQRQVLRKVLHQNTGCAYGKMHGFEKVSTYEEFRERVPLVDYDDLEPWIERIRLGEKSVLTNEPVTRLLPTSGSSGDRKLIPFTATLQQEFNAAIGPWIIDLCRKHPIIPFGPAYWSISPAISNFAGEESAVPIGFDDDSAYLGGFRRRLIEVAFAVPSALRIVPDIETNRYLTLLFLLRQRSLTLISVWHPSFLTLLLDAIPRWWDDLSDDIRAGGCRRVPGLAAELRRALPPNASRAKQLQQANSRSPQSLWPHLQVISCWGDGQSTLALADLQRRLPQVSIQAKGLLATEAFVSIPFRGVHPIAVTSHFFEFIDEAGNVFMAHQLQRGNVYSVVVTTAGGLWRYRLGDLIEVDGSLKKTPSIRFLGRGSGVSDLCGEKLTEKFVTESIHATCTTLGWMPPFAMLAPEFNAGRWCYTLFIEGEAPGAFATVLESQLRKNPHYALARDLDQLGPLQDLRLESGAHERFIAVGVAKGRQQGEIKPSCLSSSSDWRESFNCLGSLKG